MPAPDQRWRVPQLANQTRSDAAMGPLPMAGFRWCRSGRRRPSCAATHPWPHELRGARARRVATRALARGHRHGSIHTKGTLHQGVQDESSYGPLRHELIWKISLQCIRYVSHFSQSARHESTTVVLLNDVWATTGAMTNDAEKKAVSMPTMLSALEMDDDDLELPTRSRLNPLQPAMDFEGGSKWASSVVGKTRGKSKWKPLSRDDEGRVSADDHGPAPAATDGEGSRTLLVRGLPFCGWAYTIQIIYS